MSNIDKQALRADALEATGGSWVRESGEGWEAICCDDDQGNAGFIIAEFQGENATANRKFVQSANPATLLALLDELEAAEKRIAELGTLAFNPALLDVIAERQRQMSVEGWTPKHDDKHDNNELAFAASCYAFHSAAASWDFEDDGTPYDIHPAPKNWPWSPEWWKPKNPRRDLVKAGALILAEIERIDRQEAAK
ncbi:ead/Ea22-like family protein [Enterobacter cloacae subsp. cloacae]